jgi:hypothetical protein
MGSSDPQKAGLNDNAVYNAMEFESGNTAMHDTQCLWKEKCAFYANSSGLET